MGFQSEDDESTIVLRYELMLKGNSIVFFDSIEFEQIVVYYLNEGEVQKATKALQVGLAQHPDAFELKLLEVEILILNLKTDKAKSILDDLSKKYPYHSEVQIQRANLLSRQGRYHQSISILKSVLSESDDPVRVEYILAMQYLQIEDYASALLYFRRCLQQEPENKLFLQQLMFCYDFLEEVSDQNVINYLEDYLKSYPYNVEAWFYLGKYYAKVKDYEKAIECYDYAIISDDSFFGGYFEKAKVLEEIKQYEEAINYYEKTLHLADPTPYVYLRMGKCYQKKFDFQKAEVLYRRAIYEDPQFDQSWFELSKLNVQKKDFESALKAIEKAIGLDRLNLTYHLHRVCVCELLKDMKYLFFSIKEACEISDDYKLKNLLLQMEQYMEESDYKSVSLLVDQIKTRLFFL